LVCILSVLTEVVSNTVYQGYLFLLSAYEVLESIPEKTKKLRKNILETVSILSNTEARGFWWLGLKLDIRNILTSIEASISQFTSILKKFYLFFIVGLALVVLNGGILAVGGGTSKFGVVLNNHSYIAGIGENQVDSVKLSGISLIKQDVDDKAGKVSEKIITHKIKEAETLDSIAELYGVKAETIRYNNGLTDAAILPATLSIPWIDAAIYKISADTTPEEIEVIYKIDKNQVYSLNEDVIDRDSGKFLKDSTILLPTTDFEGIVKSQELEKNRQEVLKQTQERRSRQQKAVAYTNGDTYINATSDQRSAGFIWPASGSISRCLQPGHIACDIANASAPPIFAVKDGVISDVYRFTVVGYGNAVVISHGDGLKTLYAHMSEIYVSPGQVVKQGQAIGRMGCTGFCTGTHVHFEVIVNGVKQNPRPYLP